MSTGDDLDAKGLIREAYRIEGITYAECRSIFLDWALSAPIEADTHAAIGVLLTRYGTIEHPMTQVLREGRVGMEAPRRRGGWRGRDRDKGRLN